jgi:hypothetical protein
MHATFVQGCSFPRLTRRTSSLRGDHGAAVMEESFALLVVDSERAST